MSGLILLTNGWILDGRGNEFKGSLLLENGKIERVLVGDSIPQNFTKDGTPVIDLKGKYLAPGFVDVHVHGGNGFDTMDGTYEAISEMSKFHAIHGTTSFLPTTMTASIPDIIKALKAVKEAMDKGTSGAEVLGCHLEGPFISANFKGAQQEEHIHPPSIEVIQSFLAQVGPMIRLLTLAPEEPGAGELIGFLKEQGIAAAAGHTNATYDQMEEAISQGIRHIVHCYNSMRGLHHREPGVVGAALVHDEVSTELIADGVHVHSGAMKLVVKVKKQDKVVLVSDSIRAAGLPDGIYDLGGQDVIVQDGICRLKSGNLAGSTLTLASAVKNMVDKVRIPLPLAVQMATFNPAQVIGVHDRKGSVEEGKDADLIILDKELHVTATLVGGKIVSGDFERGQSPL